MWRVMLKPVLEYEDPRIRSAVGTECGGNDRFYSLTITVQKSV